MTELKVYNSQGKQFGTDQPDVSSRIENFFFGGVRLYVETGPEVELVAFFRARESKASRAEQYYAVYQTDTTTQLFEKFTAALREEMENKHGMMLQTTSEDVQLFAGLATEYSAPGSHTEHDRISSLLAEGKQLKFGVSSNNDALGLLRKYLDGSTRSIAIAEDASNDALNDCDLVIELGSDESFEPLGDTGKMLVAKKRQQSAGSSRPRKTTVTTPESRLDKIKRIGMPVLIAGGVFVAVLVLGIIMISVAGISTGIETLDNMLSILLTV